jgi:hypothetical protein
LEKSGNGVAYRGWFTIATAVGGCGAIGVRLDKRVEELVGLVGEAHRVILVLTKYEPEPDSAGGGLFAMGSSRQRTKPDVAWW